MCGCVDCAIGAKSQLSSQFVWSCALGLCQPQTRSPGSSPLTPPEALFHTPSERSGCFFLTCTCARYAHGDPGGSSGVRETICISLSFSPLLPFKTCLPQGALCSLPRGLTVEIFRLPPCWEKSHFCVLPFSTSALLPKS